jgi:hypothetical protein
MPVGLRQTAGVLPCFFTSDVKKSLEQNFEVICGLRLVFLQQICGVPAGRFSH